MSDEKSAADTPQKLYEGKPISDSELQKVKENLPEGKHLLETNPGEFHSLSRLRG